jgi:hypothetical protein
MFSYLNLEYILKIILMFSVILTYSRAPLPVSEWFDLPFLNCKHKSILKILIIYFESQIFLFNVSCRGADKSLARPGRKQPTGTEDFEFHIPYL